MQLILPKNKFDLLYYYFRKDSKIDVPHWIQHEFVRITKCEEIHRTVVLLHKTLKKIEDR